ncbi:MAG: V-type ATP synthase subunit D [Bacteroidales bacterium]|jgi:V/A-type H+-transporting ATPase subunit D|nr:V-type ATP synthase subunit D [Bacteroidales bacterium]
MAIKFQYNKTSMQQLEKQLKIRVRTLPTIKSKESALRLEVKRSKEKVEEFDERLEAILQQSSDILRLWGEFKPDILSVKEVRCSTKKIAGVNTPVYEGASYEIKEFSVFNMPAWILDGIEYMKSLIDITLEREFWVRKMELLSKARKKTTQKVNLYEKVQIPGFEDAIRKIKRVMEDEENLSKAAQKIVKMRQEKEVAL